MKYLRSSELGCKDIGIRKSEFVALTQILFNIPGMKCHEEFTECLIKLFINFNNATISILGSFVYRSTARLKTIEKNTKN